MTKTDAVLECPHSFGYLAGYPQDEPIPDECFGCPRAVECMDEKTETVSPDEVAKRARQQ